MHKLILKANGDNMSTNFDEEIHIKVTKQQSVSFREEAKKEEMTLSEFIRNLLREYLKQKR